MSVSVYNETQDVEVEFGGWELEDLSVREVNELSLSKSSEDDVAQGDEITFSVDGEGVFRGFVRRVKSDSDRAYDVFVFGSDEELQRARVEGSFSSIAYEDLVKEVVEDNTDWSVSTESTGQVLDEKEYDDSVASVVSDAVSATGFQVRVDTFNRELFFEEDGSGGSKELYGVGSDANARFEEVEVSTEGTADTVKVEGKVRRKEKVDEFSASDGQTDFVLSREAVRLESVSVNGESQVKAPSGDSDAADFHVGFVDDGDRVERVIFSDGLSDSDDVEVVFYYTSRPSAVATTGDADAEGFKKFQVPSVTSESEAESVAERLVERVSSADVKGTIQYNEVDFDLFAGMTVELYDETRGLDGTEVTVKKVTHSGPGNTTLNVGSTDDELMRFKVDSESKNDDTFEKQGEGFDEIFGQNSYLESSQWTRTEGWHFDLVNNDARQVVWVYVPDKKYVRYVELDLVRVPLKLSTVDADFSEVNTESQNPYDFFGEDNHPHDQPDSTAEGGGSSYQQILQADFSSTSLDDGEDYEVTESTTADFDGNHFKHQLFLETDTVNAEVEIYASLDDSSGLGDVFKYPLKGRFTTDEGGELCLSGVQIVNMPEGTDVTWSVKNVSGESITVESFDWRFFGQMLHDHTIPLDETESNTTGGVNEADNDQLNTANHAEEGHSVSSSFGSGDEPGSVDVEVDVTPLDGSTENVGTLDGVDVDDTFFGLDIPLDYLERGFNYLEIYTSGSDTVNLASMLRMNVTDRE